MAKQLFNVPPLQKLTATGVLANDTYNLLQTDEHSGRSAMNLIPLVVDLDLSLGSIIIDLPALGGFFGGASAGVGFMLHGTIVGSSAVNTVTLRAFNSEPVEIDRICGAPTVVLSGIGTAFKVWISGRLNWGAVSCTATPIP